MDKRFKFDVNGYSGLGMPSPYKNVNFISVLHKLPTLLFPLTSCSRRGARGEDRVHLLSPCEQSLASTEELLQHDK
jgi:hypothetical protein